MSAAAPSSWAGLRVLITRPEEQAEETAEQVRAAGGVALVYPCLRLAPPPEPAPLQAALAQLERYTWVALTSANAARAVAAALRAGPPGLRIAAVGPRTAACLREHGLPVALCAGDNAEADTAATAEGLCAALLALWRREGRAAGAERVLLPRAAEGREALAAGLAAAGVAVTAVTAYQMAPAEPAALAPLAPLLAAGGVDLVPFGSPRSADLVLDALGTAGPHLLRRFAVGAMGTTTKTALRARGVQVDASALAPATFAGLLDALAAVHWQRRRAGDEKS